jgi:nitrile hydratase subunit beta
MNSGTAFPKEPRQPSVVSPRNYAPIFANGDMAKIAERSPVGHYRVPTYLRGKVVSIESVIERAALDNEEEGFGRNAGIKRHYYRVALLLKDVWPDYKGSHQDGMRIEVYETWLERI